GSHALVLLSIKAQMDSKFVVAALSGRFHSVNGNDCRREASRWKIKRPRVDSRPGPLSRRPAQLGINSCPAFRSASRAVRLTSSLPARNPCCTSKSQKLALPHPVEDQ